MTAYFSCTWLGVFIILIGSIGNWLCVCVFCRKRFRSSMLTPFFIALLVADCIYLTFRVIKLLYYQQTLFHNFFSTLSCSSSLLIRIYAYFTQYAPQILVPLCHYEFYVRFSLILMSFLAVQRAYDMCNSSYRIVRRNTSARNLSLILIAAAFTLAYLFEFFGLSIFCSSALSARTSYEWYNYLRTNLSDELEQFIAFARNQSASDDQIACLAHNGTACSEDQRVQLVRTYSPMSC